MRIEPNSRRHRPRRHRGLAVRLAGLCVLAWTCGAPPPALAHAAPKAIEAWGAFLPESLVCLRVIGEAVHACFLEVVGIEQRCQDASLNGQTCDRDQVDAEVREATRQVRARLGDECLLGELTEIGYIGFPDAAADLDNACEGQARAAVAALYAPVRAGASSPTAARCMADTASYARKVMRLTLERQTPVMERIASRVMPSQEKVRSIIRVGQEITQTRDAWSADLLARCPEFESVYGRTPSSLLRSLKQKTDCVLSLTYVHSAALCDPPTCGNGIPEGSEQCDDGNAAETDGCRSDCTADP